MNSLCDLVVIMPLNFFLILPVFVLHLSSSEVGIDVSESSRIGRDLFPQFWISERWSQVVNRHFDLVLREIVWR